MKIDLQSPVNFRRILALIGLSLALLAICFFAADITRQDNLNHYDDHQLGADFLQFWASAKLVTMHIPEGPYQQVWLTRIMALVNEGYNRQIGGYNMYNNPLYYPPIFLIYIAPFGYLSYFTAYIAFFVTTLFLYMAGLWKLCSSHRWLWFFMFGFSGIWLNLVVGQNGMLTAGLLAFALYFLPRNATIAGIFFGLMCYKPQLGLIIPFALLAGFQWRAIFFAAITVIGAIAYSLILFGPDTWLLSIYGNEFAFAVLQNQATLWKRMPTLYALMRLQGFAHAAAITAQLWLMGFALIAVMWVWFKTNNIRLRGAALAAGMLLAAPFGYDYDYAILGVAIVLLIQDALATRWLFGERLFIGLAFFMPALINRFYYLINALFGVHLQLGFVTPLLLLLLALRRLPADGVAQKEPPALKLAA